MEAQNHYNQLFAQAMTTPVLMANSHPHPTSHSHSHSRSLDNTHIQHLQRQLNTPPPRSSSPIDLMSNTAVKVEDFSYNPSAMASLLFSTPPPTSHCEDDMSPAPSTSQSTPPPSDSKPVKKRKSWGQVLPEPKTNLPPRKRAKTEDEKEQRRIERVKRNRLAAHNSRERKRQEVELLQKEKESIEDELENARAAMARMAAQLKAFQKRYPGEVFDTPAMDESYESLIGQPDTVCPRQTSFPSPISMNSIDSPRDDPETPAYSESLATDLDQTRYPAAILCDLQCQSTSVARSLQSKATMTYLTLFNMTLHLMKSLSTTFSALTRSQIESSMTLSSPPLNPLQAWWLLLISSALPSSTPTPQTLTAFLSRSMLKSTSNCRQPLAQRFPLATRLSQMKRSSIECVEGSSKVVEAQVPSRVGVQDHQHSVSQQGLEFGSRRRHEMLTLKPHLKRWLESLEQNSYTGQDADWMPLESELVSQ